MSEQLYNERLKRVADAVALKEPDKVPLIAGASGIPYFLSEGAASHKDSKYDFDKAVQSVIKYHEEFDPDIASGGALVSGKADEIAGSTMIDWPGRPGTKVSDYSTHQVIEQEYMPPEEYPEMLGDFTGYMLRKYMPRAFPGLAGLSAIKFVPSIVLTITQLPSLFSPPALEAYEKLSQIAAEHAKAATAGAKLNQVLCEMGFPPYQTGAAQAPFDIIGDYFRGTMGMFFDQVERPEMIAAAADMFADIQIEALQYLKDAPLPVKRVFFPLHKGMDGFVSPEQYKALYWDPMFKIFKALVDIGATPIIYTEGPYNTRVATIKEGLETLPPGSCIVHFEEGDFASLKKEFEGLACISGGISLYTIEWDSKQRVIDRVKYLIDNCAAGGGYLMNTGGGIENAPRENIEAMFDTVRTYGKK